MPTENDELGCLALDGLPVLLFSFGFALNDLDSLAMLSLSDPQAKPMFDSLPCETIWLTLIRAKCFLE